MKKISPLLGLARNRRQLYDHGRIRRSANLMHWRLNLPTLRAFAVFSIAFMVIAARRWSQIEHPDVWVEDGTQVIPSFLQNGWAGVFIPVNGYLILPAKVVSYSALTLSFSQYALISTIISIIVQAIIIVIVALSPTLLPAPYFSAFLIAFLPVGSEVYALPLYTFWWTTILIFVGLLWRGERHTPGRVLFVLIGGLSSPFIVAGWPIFCLRALVQRTRSELMAMIAALLTAALQVFFLIREHVKGVSPLDASHNILMLVSKYFGTALYSLNQPGATVFGLFVIAFLIVSGLIMNRVDRFQYAIIGICLAIAVLTSVSRVPVEAPHPLLAGPRYFFFPLILTGWMLIYIAVRGRRAAAMVAMVIAGAYIPSLAIDFVYESRIPKQSWSEQVAACVATPTSYSFDIQYGVPDVHWSQTISGDDCRRLAARALF